jgi:hypothetical protein
MIFAQEEKIVSHFKKQLGSNTTRSSTFNWTSLGYQQQDLSILKAPFSQDEIKETIDSMPGDEATGPDGFHWCLLQTVLGNHQI